MKKMHVFVLLFLTTTVNAYASTLPLQIDLEVLPLSKDAKLLGVKKIEIQQHLATYLKELGFQLKKQKRQPYIHAQITTMDSNGVYVSQIALFLYDIVQVRRTKKITYAVIDRVGTMASSSPTEHKALLKKKSKILLQKLLSRQK